MSLLENFPENIATGLLKKKSPGTAVESEKDARSSASDFVAK